MTDGFIDRVGRVGVTRDLAPGARNRFVVEPAQLDLQSPFVLLVEDFIEPESGFHPHNHSGLETVTFVLSGALRHGDHLGNSGVLHAGDIQWMTAGRGIEHGGEPIGGSVHALQLWVALPRHLRNSAPGTREQRRLEANIRELPNVTIASYGVPTATDDRRWSEWPLTVTYLETRGPAGSDIEISAGDRAFFYVVDGAIRVDGRGFTAGDVAWIAPAEERRRIAVASTDPARLICYAGAPLHEDIVAHGPFVGGSIAELQQMYSDFREGERP